MVTKNPIETTPQWLDATERAVWLKLAALMSRLPAELDAQLHRDGGLTFFEYSVLAALSERPDGVMRMSDLAVLARGSLSRLSHVASKLERRDLIRREPCPADGRYTNAILTEDGRDLITRVAPLHVAAVRHLVFDAIESSGLSQLGDTAHRILARIDPDQIWPS